jgi:hypothetical protein
MSVLILILLIFGFVCFVLAAFTVPVPPRVNLIALGLAFWIFATILESHPIVLH